jgi:RecB family exonuclease
MDPDGAPEDELRLTAAEPRKRRTPRRPAAPRLPRFSPTRIELYLFCPRAYHLYYDRRLKWGGPRTGHAFGGSLHRALQVFHNRGGAEAVPLEDLLGTLRERWSDAGFTTPEEAEAHLASGEALLEHYYQAHQEPGRETLWTERTVQHPYPEFVLFGKVDRLDRRPDGALDVIDYKSGRHRVTEADVRNSLPLAIYQLLVARQNPGVPVYTSLYALQTCESASVLRSPAELDQVEHDVREIVARILADERMAPIPGPNCRDCVYPRVCPAGRNWLLEDAMRRQKVEGKG